jgi:tetratricopeptide (TPR) repeat protein
MPEHPRIEELRRRVQEDPASIAFAQLAEEYRRAGNYEEAVATCRAGLVIHPGYLSARVTLGRALIEIKDLDAAEVELMYVLQHASENLSAIRGMAEIYHRRGNLIDALAFYQAALGLAKHDPDLEQAVAEISRSLSPQPAPAAEEGGLTFEEASAEFLSALDELSVAKSSTPGSTGEATAEMTPKLPPMAAAKEPQAPTAVPELERFLNAISSYRQRKAV